MRRSKPGENSVRIKTGMNSGIANVMKLRDEIKEASTSEIVPQKHGFAPLRGGRTRQTESCVREILERVVRGESLRQICQDEHMPAECTVWRWIQYDPVFAEEYYKAKERQLDAFAEQILTIADDSSTDVRMAYDKFGNRVPEVNYENVKRSELRIKSRQWLMERLQPRKYGDKMRQDVDSGSRSNSQTTMIQIMLPDNGRPIEAQTIEVKNGNNS